MRSVTVPSRKAAQVLNRINGAATTEGEYIKANDIAEVIDLLREAGVSPVRIGDFIEYATEDRLTVFRGPETSAAWDAFAWGPAKVEGR